LSLLPRRREWQEVLGARPEQADVEFAILCRWQDLHGERRGARLDLPAWQGEEATGRYRHGRHGAGHADRGQRRLIRDDRNQVVRYRRTMSRPLSGGPATRTKNEISSRKQERKT